MILKPGTNLTRLPSNRKAQLSAITASHGVVYYPDTDQQTNVRHNRFTRTNEWRIHWTRYNERPTK